MKDEIGYYIVNEKKFDNKFEAVLFAQETNSKLDWYFFDDILNKVDWFTEPEENLDHYYRIRAEQIREKYDYVIIFCSGGSDSTNVIKTFINNNIKVDEVIGIAPLEGLKNWKYHKTNYSSLNTISETKFALFPLLDELSSKHGIKTTILDYFNQMIKYKDEEWTFNSSGNIVTTLTSHFTDITLLPHVMKIIESGKKVALVYGTDKPLIRISPVGQMMFVIGDGGINYLNMPKHRSFPNLDRVLFYYTADLPKMMVKQAHVVGKVIFLPEFKTIYEKEILASESIMKFSSLSFNDVISQKNEFIDKKDIFNFYKQKKIEYDSSTAVSYRTMYQRAIVPFIYPSTYDKDLWQAQKIEITEGFFTRDQDWVHILHRGSKLSEMLFSGSKIFYDSISPKYLNYKGTGFKPFSKVYQFGHTKIFRDKYKANF